MKRTKNQALLTIFAHERAYFSEKSFLKEVVPQFFQLYFLRASMSKIARQVRLAARFNTAACAKAGTPSGKVYLYKIYCASICSIAQSLAVAHRRARWASTILSGMRRFLAPEGLAWCDKKSSHSGIVVIFASFYGRKRRENNPLLSHFTTATNVITGTPGGN